MSVTNQCESFKAEYDDDSFSFSDIQAHQVAWVVAGTCMFVSVLISLDLIWRHVKNYRRPEQQRHIIRYIVKA